MKKIGIPLFIFFCIVLGTIAFWKKEDYSYKLSILAIFQNEERFLKEWIDFHRLMGVEHFYLFNHLSSDDYLSVLQPYLSVGLVELYDWPYPSQEGNEADWTRVQSAAYREGIARAKGNTKWLAILDADEFLFPVQAFNLTDWLSGYEECSGILVNWQVFGTSHVPKIADDQLLIEQLTYQAPVQEHMNTYCKSIVRPEAVKTCCDPHTVVYYPWSYAVDVDKYIFPWKFHASHPVKVDQVRINHYWSRDEDFLYNHKLARYAKWGTDARREACLKRNEVANQCRNDEIQRFVPALQALQAQDQKNFK